MLVLRDVFMGVTRFDHIEQRLGISRNILNQRLSHLVEEGVLERVQYTHRPPRYEYRLTDKGRDLGRSSRPCASGVTVTPPPTGLPSA